MVAPGDGDCRPMVKGGRKRFLCTLFHLLNFKAREETVCSKFKNFKYDPGCWVENAMEQVKSGLREIMRE